MDSWVSKEWERELEHKQNACVFLATFIALGHIFFAEWMWTKQKKSLGTESSDDDFGSFFPSMNRHMDKF